MRMEATQYLFANFFMEDKIFDIVTDLIRDNITKDEAIDKLLVLYNVCALNGKYT